MRVLSGMIFCMSALGCATIQGGIDYPQNLPSSVKPIHLEITSHLGDGQTFLEGDPLSFFLSLDQEAYLLVIYEDASGVLTQIIPNHASPQKLYPAKFFISVPDENASYRFRVQAPFGKEKIWAFAADVPIFEMDGIELGNGLRQLQTEISKIRDRFISRPPAAFGEAMLLIQTKAKPSL